MMAPLVRRSWSPQGQTPVLHQRTRSYKKVSAIAALCISPCRDRVHLYFRLHSDASIDKQRVVEFLRILLRQLDGPTVLVWDRLRAHRARLTQDFIQSHDTFHTYLLPAYAPELNPVENVWSYLKMNPLCNLAITDLQTLADVSRRHGRALQRKENLLRAFIRHTPLSLRLL